MQLRLLLILFIITAIQGCDVPRADISGKITYDNVPHSASTHGLDYSNTVRAPIRGVVVEAIENGSVIASSPVDNQGNYLMVIEMDKTIKLRVRSELINSTEDQRRGSWNVKVVDNTNQKAVYVLESPEFKISKELLTKNLHAASGWNNSSYASTRSAAPFHILDRIYDILLKLEGLEQEINLPAINLNWSVNNVPEFGDRTTGQIGTSFYQNGEIYLLGAENLDTDEYDGHVIIHEWGHFFEDVLARSDSIGGPHAGGDRLDMRVAFGEGFGNAWAAIITDNPIYQDSLSESQAGGFSIDVESNNNTNPGWYSEGSVQSILYDLYDQQTDGADNIQLGLQPLFNILIGPQKESEAFTSIFSFMTYMMDSQPQNKTEISSLLAEQNINSNIDIWGTNETDNARETTVLPIYSELSVQDKQSLCTSTTFGSAGNKLSNHRFLKLNVSTAGNYTLRLTPKEKNDLDAYLYVKGERIAFTEDPGTDVVNLTADLPAGVAVVDTLAYNEAGTAIADACYDIELLAN